MRYKGIVDWFDIEKGFGFIDSDAFEEKIFVHFSALIIDGFKYVEKGDKVTFEVILGNRGYMCTNVIKSNQ